MIDDIKLNGQCPHGVPGGMDGGCEECKDEAIS